MEWISKSSGMSALNFSTATDDTYNGSDKTNVINRSWQFLMVNEMVSSVISDNVNVL